MLQLRHARFNEYSWTVNRPPASDELSRRLSQAIIVARTAIRPAMENAGHRALTVVCFETSQNDITAANSLGDHFMPGDKIQMSSTDNPVIASVIAYSSLPSPAILQADYNAFHQITPDFPEGIVGFADVDLDNGDYGQTWVGCAYLGRETLEVFKAPS